MSIIPFLLAFILTFVFTSPLANALKKRGIVGVDLHKENKPEIPEMGGLAILLGFILSIAVAFALNPDQKILIGASITVLVGALGIIDGFKKLSAFQKVAFLSIIGILLVPSSRSDFFGCGLACGYLIFVPIFFMCTCNFTNMLAGFNGLEIGTGAIACLGMAAVSYTSQQPVSFYLTSAMAGGLLAFLYYNRYPAKVFPGDVGTLIIGATIFSATVFGRLELAGLIIFMPYIADAALKYFSVGVMTRESQRPTEIKDGKLYVPEGSNLSLPRFFLKRRPMTEEEVVYRVWAVEAVAALLAVAVGFLVR